nr:HSP70 nucleotide exchange factor FES1-like [Tanacetum cinerariifolium]
MSAEDLAAVRDERQLVDSLWTTHCYEPSSLRENVSWFFLVLTLNLLILLFLKQIWFSSASLQQPKPSPHCLALPYSPRWKRVKYSSLGPLLDLLKPENCWKD